MYLNMNLNTNPIHLDPIHFAWLPFNHAKLNTEPHNTDLFTDLNFQKNYPPCNLVDSLCCNLCFTYYAFFMNLKISSLLEYFVVLKQYISNRLFLKFDLGNFKIFIIKLTWRLRHPFPMWLSRMKSRTLRGVAGIWASLCMMRQQVSPRFTRYLPILCKQLHFLFNRIFNWHNIFFPNSTYR